MTAQKGSLPTSRNGIHEGQGASPEEALEAINSYYENVSDDQFIEGVRDACADVERGSIAPPARAEEENSESRPPLAR